MCRGPFSDVERLGVFHWDGRSHQLPLSPTVSVRTPIDTTPTPTRTTPRHGRVVSPYTGTGRLVPVGRGPWFRWKGFLRPSPSGTGKSRCVTRYRPGPRSVTRRSGLEESCLGWTSRRGVRVGVPWDSRFRPCTPYYLGRVPGPSTRSPRDEDVCRVGETDRDCRGQESIGRTRLDNRRRPEGTCQGHRPTEEKRLFQDDSTLRWFGEEGWDEK